MRILILLLFPLFSYSQLSIGILESSRVKFTPDSTAPKAFIAAANITDVTQISAIYALAFGLQADGLWTKMKAIYPFVGGTASSHKYNLKDPRDVDVAYRLLFVGGWTHSSTGALPDGSTAYANTYLIPNVNLNNTSTHLSYYSRSNTAQGCDIGVNQTSEISIYIKYSDNNYYNVYSTTINTYANSSGTGFYINNKYLTNFQSYKNNTKVVETTVASGNLPASRSVFIAAVNVGSPADYGKKECAFASIGDGFTDTEAANFYIRVQAFQTALSRQIAP